MPYYMVYLRERHPRTSLMLWTEGGSYSLRDYSGPNVPGAAPRIVENQTTLNDTGEQIREQAAAGKNRIQRSNEHQAGDYPYWHAQTSHFNTEWGPIPPIGLRVRFWEIIKPHFGQAIVAGLIALGGAILAWFGWHR